VLAVMSSVSVAREFLSYVVDWLVPNLDRWFKGLRISPRSTFQSNKTEIMSA
jgi:hypothetical protein